MQISNRRHNLDIPVKHAKLSEDFNISRISPIKGVKKQVKMMN